MMHIEIDRQADMGQLDDLADNNLAGTSIGDKFGAACLVELLQEIDPATELRGCAQENRDSMKSAAACNLDRGDSREGNRFLIPSAANLQMIAAIEDFIHQPVYLRLPEEKGQGRAKDSNGNRARQRISPQACVERRGRGDEQNQCHGAQPNSPLEQCGVFKGNGAHLYALPGN